MKRVLDCSVIFKWVVAEPLSDKALQLRDDFKQGRLELHVPDLLPIEMGQSLLKAERKGRIPQGDSLRLLTEIITLTGEVHWITHPSLPYLLPQACALAVGNSNASVYDCMYVALAQREQCELITADDQLVRDMQATCPFIVPLSSIP